MNKISKISYKFSLLFKLLIVIYPLLIMAMWLGVLPAPIAFGFRFEAFPQDLLGLDIDSIRLTLRFYAGLVDMLPTAAVMLSFYYLVKLFQLYAENIIFSYQNVRYIRKIGFALLLQVLAMILVQPFLSMILTFDAAKGGHMIAVSVGTDEISNLVIGGIVILVSWVMEEGRKLEEEKELTV